MKPRILLTGASGFVGSNLARMLVHQGYPVAILVRPESKLDALGDDLNSLRVFRWDGSYESVRHALAEAQASVVIHVASMVVTEHKTTEIPALIAGNITFGTYLLEAMAACGVQHLVNTGTSWQHYQNQPYLPVNLYAATKQAFYDILAFYVDAHRINAISLELFDTYGPNDTRKKIIPLLLHAWRTGVTLDMSPGEQEMVLVHIADVCAAYLVAVDRLTASQTTGHHIYTVAAHAPIQLKSLVDLIGKLTGRQVPVNFGKRAYRPREVMRTWLGETLPGWSPMVKIENEIRVVFNDTNYN